MLICILAFVIGFCWTEFCYVAGDDNDLCNSNSRASLSKLMSKGKRGDMREKEEERDRREGKEREKERDKERDGGKGKGERRRERERRNPM